MTMRGTGTVKAYDGWYYNGAVLKASRKTQAVSALAKTAR